MTRITKEWLKARVQTLNIMLDRPVCIFNPGATASQQNIGHLSLDKNSTGYKLVEIVSGGGSESDWSPRLSPKDTDLFITGVVRGIALRNAQLAAMLIKNELLQHVKEQDVALYSPDNAHRLLKLREQV